MKYIFILGFIFTFLAYCLSNKLRNKNKKNSEKSKKQYNGNPAYYAPPVQQAQYQPQVAAYPYQYAQQQVALQSLPGFNQVLRSYNENLIDITKSQSDRPIKISNVL